MNFQGLVWSTSLSLISSSQYFCSLFSKQLAYPSPFPASFSPSHPSINQLQLNVLFTSFIPALLHSLGPKQFTSSSQQPCEQGQIGNETLWKRALPPCKGGERRRSFPNQLARGCLPHLRQAEANTTLHRAWMDLEHCLSHFTWAVWPICHRAGPAQGQLPTGRYPGTLNDQSNPAYEVN